MRTTLPVRAARCENCDLPADAKDFVRCEAVATHRVWCPTWITAEDGPLDYCTRHVMVFHEARSGDFYWGWEADVAYLQYFLPKIRELMQQVPASEKAEWGEIRDARAAMWRG